jgi:hypothetical protein
MSSSTLFSIPRDELTMQPGTKNLGERKGRENPQRRAFRVKEVDLER